MRTILSVGIIAPRRRPPVRPVTEGLPRTADGHPDLQGTYDIASMTPLERAPGTPLVMTKEEAAALERQRAERVQRLALPSNGDRNAPPVGGDGSTGAAGNVGGYNNFWVDNGTEYYTIDGQKRMSVIVDPPDGRVPALTPQARQRAASRVARPTSDAQENDPGFEGPTRVRRHGAAAARRALPARIRIDVGPAGAAGALQQPAPDRADARHGADPQRDGARRARRPHERRAPAARRSASGWAIRSAAGRATRWSSTPRTSPTRRGSAGPARTCTSSSASRGSTPKTLRYRFTVEDPSTWVSAVVRRRSMAGDQRSAVRVRLPRGELRARQHPARRSAERT